MPDHGHKVVSNWIFGTTGVLSYSALAGSDNVANDAANGTQPTATAAPRLEIWRTDGAHSSGPPVAFENLEQTGTGPGSLDAWVRACRGEDYWVGSGTLEGLKAVATIDAMYRSARSGRAEEVKGCAGLG